jgi:hypothetical protein
VVSLAAAQVQALEVDSAAAAAVPRQAAAYAAAAARAADARLVPEDAADLWQQALAAAELAEDVNRYPLLMGVATSLYRAGASLTGYRYLYKPSSRPHRDWP